MALLDLTPPELIIRFSRGKTFRPIFWYLDENNSPINLTGFTARMQARVDIDDALPITGWDLTTENGGIAIVTQASYTLEAGTTVIVGGEMVELTTDLVLTNPYGIQPLVAASVTVDTSWDSAVFDIEVIEPSPSLAVLPFIQGVLEPKAEVTR